MSNNNCPSCNTDIGFLAVFKAGLPNWVKCSSCKAAVKYSPFPWLFTAACVVFYAVLLYFTFSELNSFFSRFISSEFVVEVLVIFILWVPFELALCIYLRKNCKVVLN